MATSPANDASALNAGRKGKIIRGRRYCCVVGCFNTEGSTSGVSFYSFPSKPYEKKRRQRWIQAVRRVEPDGRAWQPNANTRICSQHFVGNARSHNMYHPSYVPTIFPAAYHHPAPCDPSGQEERYQRWIERARACKKSLKDDQASQGGERRPSKRTVPSKKGHGINTSFVNNSTPVNISNARATASVGMSASDIVEVHLLELPDVVQDTIPAAKSTERDHANVLQPLDVGEIVNNASSATESSEQQQMLTMLSNQSVAAAVEPTAPSIPANSTSQGNANQSPPELLLPLATKAAILADVRSGKLSKAEIVYKYHIRWAILYDVIRNASEIDAEQRRLGLSPEMPDSHLGAEKGGLKRRPGTSAAKEGQQKAPGVFMSEDLYFNPPKKRNYMPGYSFKRVKLLVDDLPAANTEGNSSNIVAAPVTTMTDTEEAGRSVSTKTSKLAPPDVRAVSTQTLPSLGKGSLMTFMSTTNGTVAMTQVSHRRQADKGSGTATQDSETQPSDVNPEGDSEGVRSPEHLRPLHDANDYSKAKRRKVSAARRSNAVPSPQLPLVTEPADSPTSTQSSGFTLTLVKQEVFSDEEVEDIEYDPLVVPKQEPLSPQEEDCDDFAMKCEVNDEHCGDIVMKCEVDADNGDEQTLQPPSPSSVNQWDDVTVKTEPPSP